MNSDLQLRLKELISLFLNKVAREKKFAAIMPRCLHKGRNDGKMQISKYFVISLNISYLTHWLFRSIFFNLHICEFSRILLDFQFPTVVVTKDVCHTTRLLKFIYIFLTPNTIYPGECFKCVCKRIWII